MRRVGGAGVVRVGVVQRVQVPAAVRWGSRATRVAAVGQQLPQVLRGVDAARGSGSRCRRSRRVRRCGRHRPAPAGPRRRHRPRPAAGRPDRARWGSRRRDRPAGRGRSARSASGAGPPPRASRAPVPPAVRTGPGPARCPAWPPRPPRSRRCAPDPSRVCGAASVRPRRAVVPELIGSGPVHPRISTFDRHRFPHFFLTVMTTPEGPHP